MILAWASPFNKRVLFIIIIMTNMFLMKEYCSLFMKMCVFRQGWNLKYWALIGILVYNFVSAVYT